MLETLITALLVLASRTFYLSRFQFIFLEKDVTSHLTLIKAIRKNGRKIPEKIDQFLLDTNDYPNALHKLIALTQIPIAWLEKYGGFLPVLCDTLLVIWIGLISYLVGGPYTYWLLLFPLCRLFWGFEDRAFVFGERAHGVFWGNIYLSSAFLFIQSGEWFWLIPAFASFFMFSTSSKFTWQATSFITLLQSLLLLDYRYLAVFTGLLLVTAILSQGYNLRVVEGLIRHSRFYHCHLLKTNWGLRNFYGELFNTFKRLKFKKLEYQFFQNPVLKVISNFPPVIPFLAIWALTGPNWDPWCVYALSGLLLVPIIATEKLKFLGEPERYLEFAALPIFITLSHYSIQAYKLWAIFALLIGIGSIKFQWQLKKEEVPAKTQVHQDLLKMTTFIRQLPESTLLTIPLRTSFPISYEVEKHRYVTAFINAGKGKLFDEYINLTPDHSNFPGKNLETYVGQYGIDFIVLNKHFLQFLNKKLDGKPYYDFSSFETVFENINFTIFKTNPPSKDIL